VTDDRRRAVRREPCGEEPLARVRLRTGHELAVVNVSNSGVLVEGTARLLPGTRLDVHVVTRDGRVLVRCRVIRAFVCRLEADSVRYRGALAFERGIDAMAIGEPSPIAAFMAPHDQGKAYPDADVPVAAEAELSAFV
jgi:hypothetical protein